MPKQLLNKVYVLTYIELCFFIFIFTFISFLFIPTPKLASSFFIFEGITSNDRPPSLITVITPSIPLANNNKCELITIKNDVVVVFFCFFSGRHLDSQLTIKGRTTLRCMRWMQLPRKRDGFERPKR